MQVVVQKLLTHYDTSGSGPLLVLLHGWGDRLETFDGIADKLAKQFTVVRLDLPGFGATEPPKTVWALAEYAQFVADFLKKLELPRPKAIVGHSNGGAVAIVGLADGVLSSDALVLLASAGVRDRQGFKKLGLKVIAKLGKAATFWLPKRQKQRLQRKFYGTIGSDMLVAPHLKETFKRTVSQDIQPQAHVLNLPTLLIYGEHDRATPVKSIGIVLHDAITGSKLNIIHGADHFVHHAQADQVVEQIVEFVS